MKKYLFILFVMAGCIVLDLSWVAVFEKPLFALKDSSDDVNQTYYGLFYDVINCHESETYILKKGSKFACPVSIQTNVAPMVQIDGVLYLQTGRISEFLRCGVLDGEITSSTAQNQTPVKDNQSNFGSGFGYQIGKEGTVEVSMNGQWHVFASEEIFDELVLDLSIYEKVEDLSERRDADTSVLFAFEERLYAKAFAVIDYAGPSAEAEGMIEYLIPESYVPRINFETNCKELLGGMIYDVSETSAILYVDGIYHLYLRIEK